MTKSAAAFLLVALAVVHVAAQDATSTSGVITGLASTSDFDFNGQHVFCASSTKIVDPAIPFGSYLGCPKGPLFLGQGMAVSGEWDSKRHIIAAAEIDLAPAPSHDVSGSAVIDGPPVTAGGSAGVLEVRADGYRVHLDAKTSILWSEPLHTVNDVRAGDWIEYKGTRTPDGSVIATTATLKQATFTADELNARGSFEYDPSAMPAAAKQGAMSLVFKGVDPKRFPPYVNAAMQAHVTEVGEKLIPIYQRNLPDSDLAKIHFRFQLVESTVWWDAVDLPSGIILVPHEVVERMQNDSQLAAILADSIAAIIERQTYHNESGARAVMPETLKNAAAATRSAGAQLTGLGTSSNNSPARKANEQSGRVALGLMHDAGFDLNQAPIAWWLLSRKKAAPIEDLPMPYRAAYLYQMIGLNRKDQPQP